VGSLACRSIRGSMRTTAHLSHHSRDMSPVVHASARRVPTERPSRRQERTLVDYDLRVLLDLAGPRRLST
jgi:hypothetical protein